MTNEAKDALRARLKAKTPRGWYGLAAPQGWYPLINELDQKLEEVIPGYEIHQIKEKFGGLRYYIGFPEDATEEQRHRANELIREYEERVEEVCEGCGAEDAVPYEIKDSFRWPRRYCKSCADKWAEEAGGEAVPVGK